MSVKTEIQSNYPIVDAICGALNLGDKGKLISFFNKVERQLKRELGIHRANLKTDSLDYESKIDDLKFELEDAETSLYESYKAVDLDSITTNKAQTEYVETYLTALEVAENEVEVIKKHINITTKNYEDSCNEYDILIEGVNNRLSKITK